MTKDLVAWDLYKAYTQVSKQTISFDLTSRITKENPNNYKVHFLTYSVNSHLLVSEKNTPMFFSMMSHPILNSVNILKINKYEIFRHCSIH